MLAWLTVVAVPALPAGTNHPPVLDPIGNRTIGEGSTLMILVRATDPDPGDHLVFSLGSTRPDGAVIDPMTGLFRWTPGEAQGPGVYPFDIVVRDDADPPGEDSEAITVTVSEVNRAPALGSVADRSVAPGSTLTFIVTASDSDVPPQALTFSLAGAPNNATIDPAAGVFTWTPTASQVGTWALQVCVSDGSLHACRSFTVWVGTNRPPVIDSLGVPSTSYLAWDERLAFAVVAHDPDGSPSWLSYALIGAPKGASISSTGAFTWTPAGSQIGSYVIGVRVTDGGSPPLSADALFTVVVQKRLTSLAYGSSEYPGPVFSDEMTCVGHLRDASGGSRQGSPLAGASIRFAFGGGAAVAATDAAGAAETGFMVDEPAGLYPMAMSYAGSALYQSASYSGVVRVTPEHAMIRYTGDRRVGSGGHAWVQLSASLREGPDGTPGYRLAEQQLVFEIYRGGMLVRACTASVGGRGTASCERRVGPGTYHVVTRLASNGYYAADRTRTMLIVR
jgi:hypothetical protein